MTDQDQDCWKDKLHETWEINKAVGHVLVKKNLIKNNDNDKEVDIITSSSATSAPCSCV